MESKSSSDISAYFMKIADDNERLISAIIRDKVPETDVKDVYQNTMLNLWRSVNKAIRDGEEIIKTAGLAVRITQRMVVNYWRKKGREKNTVQLTLDPEDPYIKKLEKEEMKMVTLTPAQKNILWLIGLGMTNDDMALRLNISKNTLRTHIKKIHKKTGIKGRTELALFAAKIFKKDICYQEIKGG